MRLGKFIQKLRTAFDVAVASWKSATPPAIVEPDMNALFQQWQKVRSFPNQKTCKRGHRICVENANRADLRRELRYTCLLCMAEYPSNAANRKMAARRVAAKPQLSRDEEVLAALHRGGLDEALRV